MVANGLRRTSVGWWSGGTASAPAAEPDDLAALDTARERAGAVRTAIAEGPRSLRWKARAAIGGRVRWYDLPEEVR
jgi:hypothetical protein